jgi:predicted DCC family thiol-disulfide oxidoreductase YuxK
MAYPIYQKTTTMQKPQSDSPDSDPRQHRGILFYDGECGLCLRSVRFFLWADRSAQLRFAPLQGETAAKRLPADLREADCLSTVVYLRDEPGGEAHYYVRSEAVGRALIDIGGFWAWTGRALMLVPSGLREAGYRFVARHRGKIFPKSKCALPSLGQQSRILE